MRSHPCIFDIAQRRLLALSALIGILSLISISCAGTVTKSEGGNPRTDPVSYTVGGTVSGLVGSGLTLQDNGGNNLPISANGSFAFIPPIPDGSAYGVTVLTEPSSPNQTCVVASGSGTLTGSNVTSVSVACTTNTYTVGGTVSGLAGSGLILQDNGGNNLPISVNGSFVFTAALASGSAYGVTVLTQPSSPSQTCVVTSGSGTLGSNNVTSVSIACTTNTYTVGGTVSGLAGSGFTLQDNGGNNLPISANGSFAFIPPLPSGSAYGVTVLTQPSSPSQTCVVTSGSGTLGSSNVTSVSIACTTNTYTVGGTVSGLAGSGLTLQDNGGSNLPISVNGSFVFTAPLASGTAYGVVVLTEPSSPSQTCVVTSGSGTLSGSNVTSVSVVCSTITTYTVGGIVSGLAGSGLTLQDNGGNNLSVPANGSFVFTTALADGSAYGVTVSTQPTGPSQTCVVTSGSGTLSGSNVTSVSIACTGGVDTAVITWTDTYQTIDGFGASSAFESLTGAEADLFFSQTSGIGLTLLRTMVPDDGSCSSVNSTCAGAVSDMQLAIARGARVWSTPWSPPASMKSNGSTICETGTGSSGLNPGSYGSYATYLSNYLSSLSRLYGIQLYALSVQNEPDYCPGTYDGAIWSDVNFDAFIKNNLGPTLAAQGQSGVRIMMPESSQWGSFTGEADTCMTDPGCASYVGINAWHDYDNASSISNPYSSSGVGFWETEASAGPGFGPSLCGGCWDPSMADGLLWAGIIDNRMAVSNANAWNYWWLIGKNGDNEGLVNGSATATSKRLYVMGNYSKFVRPGWVRIDATHVPLSGVTVSAYKDPVSGNFAIVATNQNGSDVSVSFSLSGFTASSVTPWVTSASLNLVQQSGIGVASGTFSATLPASSVTTFAGSAGN